MKAYKVEGVIKMKKKMSKLTKEELIELVLMLALSMPFNLRESDLVWAKWLAECERNMRLNAQRNKIEDTASEEYTQYQKKVKASYARQDELYAQYEAQREAEKADESEVAK